jgi:hypothetical protein
MWKWPSTKDSTMALLQFLMCNSQQIIILSAKLVAITQQQIMIFVQETHLPFTQKEKKGS